MKKYLITVFSVAAAFAFISCGSTANIDPNANKGAASQEEPAKEETIPEVVPEDFTKANEDLLSQAEAAMRGQKNIFLKYFQLMTLFSRM